MYCLSGGCWIGSRWITLESYLGPFLEISWKSGYLGLWEEFLPVGLMLSFCFSEILCSITL